MDILLIILFLSSLVFVSTQAFDVNDCPTMKCSDDDSPLIRFPFRARKLQIQHCGLPGFDICCKQNKSIIHFQSYGSLEVRSISYQSRSISLLDPNNCVHEVFLNLNLSGTPFKYYYVLKEYKYINCSAKLSSPFTQVSCLSAPGSHVYVVEPSLSIPDFCSNLKSIGIPFPYSPYLSDNTFGLRFTWNSTDQENNEAIRLHSVVQSETGSLRTWIDIIYYKALGFTMFVFMVATLAFLKISYLEDDDENQEQKKPNAIETRRLLGDSGNLEPPRQFPASNLTLIDQEQTATEYEKSENTNHK